MNYRNLSGLLATTILVTACGGGGSDSTTFAGPALDARLALSRDSGRVFTCNNGIEEFAFSVDPYSRFIETWNYDSPGNLVYRSSIIEYIGDGTHSVNGSAPEPHREYRPAVRASNGKVAESGALSAWPGVFLSDAYGPVEAVGAPNFTNFDIYTCSDTEFSLATLDGRFLGSATSTANNAPPPPTIDPVNDEVSETQPVEESLEPSPAVFLTEESEPVLEVPTPVVTEAVEPEPVVIVESNEESEPVVIVESNEEPEPEVTEPETIEPDPTPITVEGPTAIAEAVAPSVTAETVFREEFRVPEVGRPTPWTVADVTMRWAALDNYDYTVLLDGSPQASIASGETYPLSFPGSLVDFDPRLLPVVQIRGCVEGMCADSDAVFVDFIPVLEANDIVTPVVAAPIEEVSCPQPIVDNVAKLEDGRFDGLELGFDQNGDENLCLYYKAGYGDIPGGSVEVGFFFDRTVSAWETYTYENEELITETGTLSDEEIVQCLALVPCPRMLEDITGVIR